MQLPDQNQCTHVETNAQTKKAVKSIATIVEPEKVLPCVHTYTPSLA